MSLLKRSLICLILSQGLTPPIAYAQNSILSTALEHKESMVMVRSIKENIDAPTPAGKRAYYEKRGAGVIIKSDGLIVTNLHVVHGSDKIGIRLHNGRFMGARVLHYSGEYDLVLLKVDPPAPLTPIPFADSDRVRLGEGIIHIGSSFLLNQTISGGRVTAVAHSPAANKPNNRSIEMLRVNINIYEGDSGGPLLNRAGALIGIMFAKKTTMDRNAFAIPSNKIKKLYYDHLK